MNWNTGLTGQALSIASSNDRRIRVLAGPGSGKTFSLMRRIARLIEEGADPRKILLVTFTKTAASDLKAELNKLGISGVENIKAGTLHSFCFSILIKSAVMIITGRNPRALFNFEIEFLIRDLMKKSGKGKKEIQRKIKAFEAAWARLQTDTPGWPLDQDDKIFHNDLVSYLRFHRAMLIGEVIPAALQYLRNNPHADERSCFENVFVDEYQDLNKAEQELLNIVAANSTLMIIGDEDQSIYEFFRYSYPEGIREFIQTHISTADFPLTECRRCPKLVVGVADNFIQNNVNRDTRRLIPMSTNPDGMIFSLQWSSFEEECKGIVKYVKQRILEGISPGKILILCPRRQIGFEIRDALLNENIEAHSFFNEELFEDTKAQRSLTILNLLVNKYDRIALRCWIGFDSGTANVTGYKKVMEESMVLDEEPFEILDKLLSGSISIPHTKDIMTKFDELKKKLNSLRIKTLTEIIVELFPSNELWIEPFKNILSNYDDSNSISELLNEIKLNVINPEMPINVNYVRIMSLYKSKGLTSDISIVCSVVEGLVPRIDDLDGDESIRFQEEQRRLFYVAITRPTKELVISSVVRIPKVMAYGMGIKFPKAGGQTMKAIASSFFSQLGDSFPQPIKGEDWTY